MHSMEYMSYSKTCSAATNTPPVLCCRVQAGAVDCSRVAPYLPCLVNACRVDLDLDRRSRIVVSSCHWRPLLSLSLTTGSGLEPACAESLKMITHSSFLISSHPPPVVSFPLLHLLTLRLSPTHSHSHSLTIQQSFSMYSLVPKVLYFRYYRVLPHLPPQIYPSIPPLLLSSPIQHPTEGGAT